MAVPEQTSRVQGLALERDLVRDRDVVAEEHDVQTTPQGAPGLGGGPGARDGDQSEIRRRHVAEGAVQGAGHRPYRRHQRTPALGEERLSPGERTLRLHRVLGPDGDHEIVRSGLLALRREEAGSGQELLVGRRAHERRHLVHLNAVLELPGETKKRERVSIEARLDGAHHDHVRLS